MFQEINYGLQRVNSRAICDESSEPQKYGSEYVPLYISQDLKWFGRDRLMTYIDQLKSQEFAANKEKWFRKQKVFNFDIIYSDCIGHNLDNSIKEYKTVTKKDFESCLEKESSGSIESIQRTDTSDLFLKKHLEKKF